MQADPAPTCCPGGRVMRGVLVLLHRWLGLTTAVFLALAGLTGAVIAWNHELDGWLNPALFRARTPDSPPLEREATLALVRRIEAEHPELRARYLPLHVDAGHTLQLSIRPSADPATGKPRELAYDEIFVDPPSA